jgi:hypothetical protein
VLNFNTMADLYKHSIVIDCAGYGAQLNIVARKLNKTGHIQYHVFLRFKIERCLKNFRDTPNATTLCRTVAVELGVGCWGSFSFYRPCPCPSLES